MLAKAITIYTLATVASTHILMVNPVPYGKSTLQNGPLLANGQDFPCKQRPGVYAAEGASNVYAQGSKQQLEFQGTAVHGGGSCQVSVTTDLNPTKNSVWKVIKSIEGGCPAKGQAGNMGNSASAAVPYKYDFTIPQELAAGNYTLAWTWFNKVGNREMYMNCAPMAVTGSSGSKSFMDGLPDMFVANINNGCGTADSADLKFPNPGKDVDQFNGQTTAFSPPHGGCQAATGGAGAPSAAPTGGGPAQPTSSAAAQPTDAPNAQPSNSAPTAKASVPGGVFITSPANEPVPTAGPSSATASVPAESSSAAPVPTSAPADPGSGGSPTNGGGQSSAPTPAAGGSSSSGGHAAGTACTSEGQWNCVDGKSFQRCASGTWTVVQAMAAGLSCQPGESADLTMAASVQGKRSLRRAAHFRV